MTRTALSLQAVGGSTTMAASGGVGGSVMGNSVGAGRSDLGNSVGAVRSDMGNNVDAPNQIRGVQVDGSGLNPMRQRGFGATGTGTGTRIETPSLGDMRAKQGAIVARFMTFFQRKTSLG